MKTMRLLVCFIPLIPVVNEEKITRNNVERFLLKYRKREQDEIKI